MKFYMAIVLTALLMANSAFGFWGKSKAKNCPAAEKKACAKAEEKHCPPDCRKSCCVKEAAVAEEAAAEVKEAAAIEAEVVKIEDAADVVDEVLVTIDGVAITQSQVDEKLAPMLKRAASQNMPPQFVEQYKEQIKGQIMEQMVIEKLLEKQIKAKGIVVSDQEAAEKMAGMLSEQNMTIDDFKSLLGAQGADYDEHMLKWKKQLAFEKLFEQELLSKVDVNEADAKAFYEQNKARFENAEQVKASHILVKIENSDDPNSDPNEAKAAAVAKAQELLAEVKAGGDFEALAKEHSACPSGQKGGDLGYFEKERMVKPFSEAAFAAEPNSICDEVVETQFGYHIIKVVDKKAASTTSFDEAKADVITMLANQQKQKLGVEYIQKLRDESSIVYPEKPADTEKSADSADANDTK